MTWEREQIGACTLYRGDAREVLAVLNPVDAVITDPPYGVELKQKKISRGHGRSGDVIRHGEYSIPDTPAYVAGVVVPLIEQCRRMAGSVVVTPGIRNLWAYPPSEDMGCFYSAAGTGMGRWGFSCMQPILYYGKDPYQREGLGCRGNSYGQTYPNDANTIDHPCAKPIRMMSWLVNRASLEGETVLDPFMGSGTTGVACVQLQRSFLGIELEPRYFDLACRRIEQAYAQPDLFVRPPASRVQQEVLL